MKIVIDYDDLTSMIVNDLASKGIAIDANNIEFNENGVEIVLSTTTKTVKPKKTEKPKKQEPKETAEEPIVVTEDEPEDNDNLIFQEPTNEGEDELTEDVVDNNDDDDTLFG